MTAVNQRAAEAPSPHLRKSLQEQVFCCFLDRGRSEREREKEEKTLGCNLTYIRWI